MVSELELHLGGCRPNRPLKASWSPLPRDRALAPLPEKDPSTLRKVLLRRGVGREQEIDLTSSMSGPDCPWASLDSMIRFSPQPHLPHIRLSSQCITYIALLKNFLFIFIFGCSGSSLRCTGFLWSQRAGATLWCSGFSLPWPLSLQSTGCRHKGFVSWGSHVLVAHGPSCSRRVKSSPARGPVSPALAGGFLSTVQPGQVPPFSLNPHTQPGREAKLFLPFTGGETGAGSVNCPTCNHLKMARLVGTWPGVHSLSLS